MSSEGKFKKRFDEIALKGCLDPNDVGKDLENLLDEANNEFPKLEPINRIITSNPEWLAITEMKNPAKFIREIFEWQKKWFGSGDEK